MTHIYTEENHIGNLLLMLEHGCRACYFCPADSEEFRPDGLYEDDWDRQESDPCRICQSFLGLELRSHATKDNLSQACPCHRLGEVQAIRMTEAKLRELGYL